MTSDTICCPYCNALVIVSPATVDGQRIVCRRCGESFAYHGPSEEEPAPATRPSLAESSTLQDASSPGPPPSPSLSSQRKIAVLGILALLMAAGLVLLLLREGGHGPTTGPDETTKVPHVLPTELVGLGFLPVDTNAIVAIHVAEVLQQPAGQQLLDWLQENNVRTRILEQWTGIKLEEMDHAVLGLAPGELFSPRLMLVVRTLRPYDPDEVQGAIKARRWPERRIPPLYRFPLDERLPEAYLRFVDDRTLVVTFQAKDADRVPATPRNGIAHLQKTHQLLQEINPTAQAWTVGRVSDWDMVVAVMATLKLHRTNALTVLQGVRTWAGGVSCNDDLIFNGLIGCRDEQAARAVCQFLAPEGTGISSLALRPEAEPILHKIQKKLHVTQQGPRVEVQATARFETSKVPE